MRKNQLLRDLNSKMQARSNGVLALFRQAGFEMEKPNLKTLYTISQANEEVYNSIMKLLYEGEEAANALGWADWAEAGASALSNFFGSVSDAEQGIDSAAEAKAKEEAEEKAAAEAKTKTLTVVLIIVFVFVVIGVGGFFYFKSKK